MWVQPDPDELFKVGVASISLHLEFPFLRKKKKKQKYNPELQRKSLEGREQRLKDHEEFVNKLREYSKDSRPSTFPSLTPSARGFGTDVT